MPVTNWGRCGVCGEVIGAATTPAGPGVTGHVTHIVFRIGVVIFVWFLGGLVMRPVLDRIVIPNHPGRLTPDEYVEATQRNWIFSSVAVVLLIVLGMVLGGW